MLIGFPNQPRMVGSLWLNSGPGLQVLETQKNPKWAQQAQQMVAPLLAPLLGDLDE